MRGAQRAAREGTQSCQIRCQGSQLPSCFPTEAAPHHEGVKLMRSTPQIKGQRWKGQKEKARPSRHLILHESFSPLDKVQTLCEASRLSGPGSVPCHFCLHTVHRGPTDSSHFSAGLGSEGPGWGVQVWGRDQGPSEQTQATWRTGRKPRVYQQRRTPPVEGGSGDHRRAGRRSSEGTSVPGTGRGAFCDLTSLS